MRLVDIDTLQLEFEYGVRENGILLVPFIDVRKSILAAPIVKATPIVCGRWVNPRWANSNYCCDCSICGRKAIHEVFRWHEIGIYPVCPNCGAKMYGGDTNER